MSVRSEIGPLTWGAPCQTLEKLANHLTSDTIPRTSREILYTFGRRSTVERSLRSYGLYGTTAVLQYGSTVERSMEEESQGSKVFGSSLRSHPLDARRVGGILFSVPLA